MLFINDFTKITINLLKILIKYNETRKDDKHELFKKIN